MKLVSVPYFIKQGTETKGLSQISTNAGDRCRQHRQHVPLQLILLGVGTSEHADEMIGPIREMMERDCFGGQHGMIPEIAVAEGRSAGMIKAAICKVCETIAACCEQGDRNKRTVPRSHPALPHTGHAQARHIGSVCNQLSFRLSPQMPVRLRSYLLFRRLPESDR